LECRDLIVESADETSTAAVVFAVEDIIVDGDEQQFGSIRFKEGGYDYVMDSCFCPCWGAAARTFCNMGLLPQLLVVGLGNLPLPLTRHRYFIITSCRDG